MRFHLKKSLQITVACVCLLLYINFFLLARDSFSFGFGFNIGHAVNSEAQDSQDFRFRRIGMPSATLTYDPNNTVGNVSLLEAVGLQKLQFDVYPNVKHDQSDRIISQNNFIPMSVRQAQDSGSKISLKKIFLFNGLGSWKIKRGSSTFAEQKCVVPHCSITDNRADMAQADVVIFTGLPRADMAKSPDQVWLMFLLESPHHTPNLARVKGLVNWTATYRHDSTIVAPYEKFMLYNSSVKTLPQTKNYAEGKTKKVAWFVSNCGARNGRKQYAVELAKHIQVDVYGRCGKLKCPRFQSSKCFDMLNHDYKFYLSFENSNCRDYITEKFFVNGLKHNVIPIVMGAAPEDYARAAPPHSYIHVDDFESPAELAKYLHKLDKDDTLYNQYFQWKGTGDIGNTFFWCRVCALANDITNRGHSWYDDVNTWWRGDQVCIGASSWRDKPRKQGLIGKLAHVVPPHH